MAFDGIMTRAIVSELNNMLTGSRIDKIYQPEKEDLLLQIHSPQGKIKLFASATSMAPRIYISEESFTNPNSPSGYCMLMRKNLQGGKITKIIQKNCERIIEMHVDAVNEMGFQVSKILIFEIMGKHSNIILVDKETMKVIECIKRISIDTSRVRPMFPGCIYTYPPEQDKIPFDKVTEDQFNQIPKSHKSYLSTIGGISPSISRELEHNNQGFEYLQNIIQLAESYPCASHIYKDDDGKLQEFHVGNLWLYDGVCEKIEYNTVSPCICEFFLGKKTGDQVSQRSHELKKQISLLLDKLYLKLQRLHEDLEKAENSDDLRLFGELLTANIHLEKSVPPKSNSIEVYNYYTNENINVPLDERYSIGRNAQIYYKRYGKSKIAIKEKQIQIKETQEDIDFLESSFMFLENADTVEDIQNIRKELEETGFVKKRKTKFREKKSKLSPRRFTSPSGYDILVGHNNKENDYITTKIANKKDTWFHTKDIPGSHVLLQNSGKNITDDDIEFTAAIAAWYSKGRNSSKVPVDYTEIRNIKKPNGSKPGMVIFLENKTLLIDPSTPESKS